MANHNSPDTTANNNSTATGFFWASIFTGLEIATKYHCPTTERYPAVCGGSSGAPFGSTPQAVGCRRVD